MGVSQEKLSELEENFTYFAKCPNSIMYPDDFIRAIKFLPIQKYQTKKF